MSLTILYRGPLQSCNYGCRYCPFALRRESAEELAADREALARFAGWIASRTSDRLTVFFTPWGEALVRRWYRETVATLTHAPNVDKVVAQTNLSCGLDWLDACDLRRLALWCSYHPTEVPRARFAAKCRELDRRGVRFSVGAVGVKEHEPEIRALRGELPPRVYLWINALKGSPGPLSASQYQADDLRRLEAIDPLFRLNAADHPSLGRACRTGESVVSVDGDGTIRRCHFVREPIGNLYRGGLDAALAPRPCPRPVCRCHIGYVHLTGLGLDAVFGDGALERIPLEFQVSARGR